MLYFVTYFDSHYLIKGLTLYRSLVRHAPSFRLWVLCFDDLACETLQRLGLPGVIPVSLKDFEHGDEALLRTKHTRSRVEYYFTCTPSLPLYILKHWPEVDIITYLDSDLFFFSDPLHVIHALGDNSILLVEHRFPPHLRHLLEHGIYNVGLLVFRRSSEGIDCLNWWRDRCIDWCYDYVEEDRFADQKYLDDWPTRFPGVVVLQNNGAGLAPWNVTGSDLRLREGKVMVDSHPLIFFHFHRLQQIRPWLYDPALASHGACAGFLLRRHIYGPYIRELRETSRWMAAVDNQTLGHTGSIRDGSRGVEPDNMASRLSMKIKNARIVINMILRGQLLLVIQDRVM